MFLLAVWTIWRGGSAGGGEVEDGMCLVDEETNVIGWREFEAKVAVLGPDSDELGARISGFRWSGMADTCHGLGCLTSSVTRSLHIGVDYVTVISVIMRRDCE